MAKMKPPQLFTEMLSKYITPKLKALGYVRRKQTFYITSENNWGLINFQKSTSSTKDVIIFTINLGIVSTRIYHFFEPLKTSPKPGIADAHWNERLGYLTPGKNDTWWKISEGTDIEQLGKTLLRFIEQLAVPEISKLITDYSLRDLWLSGHSPGLTSFSRLLNLLILLKQIGPSELIDPTIKELRNISRGHPAAITAEVYIESLNKLP